MHARTVFHAAWLGLIALTAALIGCESSRHFTIFGYSSRPNYDERYRTIYVPIFKSQIMLDETRRTLPFDLTKAVIRTIESTTPYKVVSDRCKADTELSGTIISLTKNILNRNQLNEIREAETVLICGLVWRDVKTGEVLSLQRKGANVLPTPGIPALDIPETTSVIPPPVAPPPGTPAANAPAPVLVTGLGDYIPELGQSTSTAYQQSINRLAVQIVSLMEKGW